MLHVPTEATSTRSHLTPSPRAVTGESDHPVQRVAVLVIDGVVKTLARGLFVAAFARTRVTHTLGCAATMAIRHFTFKHAPRCLVASLWHEGLASARSLSIGKQRDWQFDSERWTLVQRARTMFNCQLALIFCGSRRTGTGD